MKARRVIFSFDGSVKYADIAFRVGTPWDFVPDPPYPERVEQSTAPMGFVEEIPYLGQRLSSDVREISLFPAFQEQNPAYDRFENSVGPFVLENFVKMLDFRDDSALGIHKHIGNGVYAFDFGPILLVKFIFGKIFEKKSQKNTGETLVFF